MNSETATLADPADTAHQPQHNKDNEEVFVPTPKTLCSIEVRSVLAVLNAYTMAMLIIGFISTIVQQKATIYNMIGTTISFVVILFTLYALYKNRYWVMLMILNFIKAICLVVLIALVIMIIIFGKKIIDDASSKATSHTYNLHIGDSDQTFEETQDLGNVGQITGWYIFLIVVCVIEIIFTAYEIILMSRYVSYLRLRDEVEGGSYRIV